VINGGWYTKGTGFKQKYDDDNLYLHFCSKECLNIYFPPPEIKCDQCKKTFTENGIKQYNHIFCSEKCVTKYFKKLKCTFCHQPFSNKDDLIEYKGNYYHYQTGSCYDIIVTEDEEIAEELAVEEIVERVLNSQIEEPEIEEPQEKIYHKKPKSSIITNIKNIWNQIKTRTE